MSDPWTDQGDRSENIKKNIPFSMAVRNVFNHFYLKVKRAVLKLCYILYIDYSGMSRIFSTFFVVSSIPSCPLEAKVRQTDLFLGCLLALGTGWVLL